MKTHSGIFVLAIALLLFIGRQKSAADNADPRFAITIEKTLDTPFGQIEDVRIYLDNSVDPGYGMGGYDFLIDYDPSVLSFNSAEPGQLITDCGWEYFTYRHGASGNCGLNACPTGKLRLIAIAETNNGNNHPGCFGETPGANGDLATLHFLVTNDYTVECQFVPIRFVWYDCGDNAISSISGDSVFISNHIYDLHGNDLANPNSSYPTFYGANWSCDTLVADSLPTLLRLVDFYNGGVDIVCYDSIDDRGDLNLNGLSHEIADAILYSNYFVYGVSVFTVNIAGQIAASDINLDGEPLKLEDLVSLWRIIAGDIQQISEPFDSTSPNIATFTQRTEPGRGGLEIIDFASPDTLGAIQLIFDGEIVPSSLNPKAGIAYSFRDGQTFVIVEPNGWYITDSTAILEGPLLSFGESGELIQVQAASYTGVKITTIIDFTSGIGENEPGNLPGEFILHQNYPNPFNNSTVIGFDIPRASNVEFEIINLLGQTVYRLERRYSAGSHSISWDGVDLSSKNVGSGVYYYRIVAGEFVESKKMILLK